MLRNNFKLIAVNQTFAPAKTIFIAVKILIEVGVYLVFYLKRLNAPCIDGQASNGVSAAYDLIADIFESLNCFLGRLGLYLKHEITAEVKEIVVKILAQLLVIVGSVTKLIKEKRYGR